MTAGEGPPTTDARTHHETRDALTAMALESMELEEAVGGSVTDALAGWLATQYAQEAREHLKGLEGEPRLKLLRDFAQDWALLRRGDQNAERLMIDRERLIYEKHNVLKRYQRKLTTALESFNSHVGANPKAKAAFDALVAEIKHPFDATEDGPFETWEENSFPGLASRKPGGTRRRMGAVEPEIRPNPGQSD